MFTKILIANRGEIACRIAATARRMSIRTVAVYSEADGGAAHVAACDEAVLVGPAPAKESYLCADKIIAAALASGAEAVHPGYGFLSENAGFARACAQAGLVFIGPPVAAIEAMGSKSAAKTIMHDAGVPLVPGYHGANQDADFLQRQADQIGYPVLLKASAGGGGKGMRIVQTSADFKSALASCKREAISSFGDDKVLVEKYLSRPRHIEIQVFADTHGQCVYLFERDCSVQRRHQKVLEEAPAPGLSPALRAEMGQAAVAAARTVGYVGAGTVEFIANQDGSFYFMEMNTRLQVEHPVTEMITGTDLVEWQLRVAFGERLPKSQDELRIHGHAIEARIYAENPEKGFLPSIGTLRHFHTPPAVMFCLGGDAGAPANVRIDSGVRAGDTISAFYDPMLAKLIVWGEDRPQALVNMSRALAAWQVIGPATNIAFLKRLVESAPFSQADLDTGLIERNHDVLFPAVPTANADVLAFAVAAILRSEAPAAPGGGPWTGAAGWRLNGTAKREIVVAGELQSYSLGLEYLPDGWRLRQPDGSWSALQISNDRSDGAALTIQLGGRTIRAQVIRDDMALHVFYQGRHVTLHYDDPLAHAGLAEAEAGRLTAPMPGKIVAFLVSPGQKVEQGAPLLIMEAMKMEHTIMAPALGTVDELLFAAGDQVADGAQLLVFTAD